MTEIQKVEDYLKKLSSPQKEICRKIRKIINKNFPKLLEKMWVGCPWFGDCVYMVGLKDHVNLGISIKGLKKEELALLEGQGKTMRHIKFFKVNDIDEKIIIKIIKMIK